MRLSICIPIYNYDVCPLAESLWEQTKDFGDEVEIVCIDDCSTKEYRERNKRLQAWGRYVQLEENVGRARIRNMFLENTRGEYLLFLDNDSVVGAGFLKAYRYAMEGNPAVVVGGRVYDKSSDNRACHLRYVYGTEVESRSAEKRRKSPYRSFMTNNFMIRRDVLEAIRFDDRLSGYGHEDTLFGYRLEQRGVEIMHIDNPVVNGEVEQNALFLQKSIEAVESLSKIYDILGEERKCFGQMVRLLRAYEYLRRLHLLWLVSWVYGMTEKCLERGFVSGEAVSVRRYNFYKLGKFIESRKDIKS